jgi:hypothetical protein
MQDALAILDQTRREALQSLAQGEATITAGKEAGHAQRHGGTFSYHEVGLAVDVRTRDLAEAWAAVLRERLGPAWDVVVEADHLHIERDIRKVPLPTSSSGGQTG